MIILISSKGCSCCKDYFEHLLGEFKEVCLVDAASKEGQQLIKDWDIKGLPATIYKDKVVSGNIKANILKKMLNYDSENIDNDNSISSCI